MGELFVYERSEELGPRLRLTLARKPRGDVTHLRGGRPWMSVRNCISVPARRCSDSA